MEAELNGAKKEEWVCSRERGILDQIKGEIGNHRSTIDDTSGREALGCAFRIAS
jgi:hypothetical protein